MKSREDVIEGLECHKRAMYGEIDEHGFACDSCPYKDMESTCRSRTEGDLISDALALLKAQEPVKPLEMEVEHVRKEPVVFMYKCPVCLAGLQRHWVACPICGGAVKWE